MKTNKVLKTVALVILILVLASICTYVITLNYHTWVVGTLIVSLACISLMAFIIIKGIVNFVSQVRNNKVN